MKKDAFSFSLPFRLLGKWLGRLLPVSLPPPTALRNPGTPSARFVSLAGSAGVVETFPACRPALGASGVKETESGGGAFEQKMHTPILWMDEIHFAPPKKPSGMSRFPCKYQQAMASHGFKVVQDFVHPQYVPQLGSHLGYTENIRLWLSKPRGSPSGVGEFTTHFRTYFSGDWDVHWGHGILTPWQYVRFGFVFSLI